MGTSRKAPVAPREVVPEPEGGKTSPTLLIRVRDWGDHPAWMSFYQRYNPSLRRWCGRFGLDSDASDELCQRIWVELMARMRSFRYDPSRGFRNWLWRLFQSRAIDLLRKRRATVLASLERHRFDASGASSRGSGTGGDQRLDDSEPFPERSELARDDEPSNDPTALFESPETLVLHRLAAEAQDAVRSRVDPETWSAYWFVAIEDRPFRETADSLGKSYTAVYNGYKRVDRMLRNEGERRLAALQDLALSSSDSGQR